MRTIRLNDGIAQVAERYEEWAEAFVEVNGSSEGKLHRPQWLQLNNEVHSWMTEGQINALFTGYTTKVKDDGIDLTGFCKMCQATTEGTASLAKFANIPVKDFEALAD